MVQSGFLCRQQLSWSDGRKVKVEPREMTLRGACAWTLDLERRSFLLRYQQPSIVTSSSPRQCRSSIKIVVPLGPIIP